MDTVRKITKEVCKLLEVETSLLLYANSEMLHKGIQDIPCWLFSSIYRRPKTRKVWVTSSNPQY